MPCHPVNITHRKVLVGCAGDGTSFCVGPIELGARKMVSVARLPVGVNGRDIGIILSRRASVNSAPTVLALKFNTYALYGRKI